MDKITTIAGSLKTLKQTLSTADQTKTQSPLDQIATIPPDLAPITDGLVQLKLRYWCEALEKDWPTIKPADQQWLASVLKNWIETELASRYSATIKRRIHDAKFIRMQTVDQFDFQYNASTRAIEKDYLKLHQKTLEGHIPRAVLLCNQPW